MTTMFSIFTFAIKFDCVFLTIFQSFHLFVGFIFDKLAPFPLNICFKRCFKSLFSPLQCIKQSQSAKKRNVFPILHFGRHINRGLLPPPPWLRYWYCVRFEQKCAIIKLLLCYAFVVEKCEL